MTGLTPREVLVGGSERAGVPHFVGYAFCGFQGQYPSSVRHCGKFDLRVAWAGDLQESLADFDGVLLYAGSFERVSAREEAYLLEDVAKDVDRRALEVRRAIGIGKPVIYLVPFIPRGLGQASDTADLFRRLMFAARVEWESDSTSVPSNGSRMPEFDEYLKKHGAVYVSFRTRGSAVRHEDILDGDKDAACAFILDEHLYVLPSTCPENLERAIRIAADAIECVLAYRIRIADDLPAWADAFRFAKEDELRRELDTVLMKQKELEGGIDAYRQLKRILTTRSDPLVRDVVAILSDKFSLDVRSEEQFVEDAGIYDADGQLVGVIEVKGVNRNIRREDVNQVDTHRQLRKLPSHAPAMLVVNTLINAASMAEKDQPLANDVIDHARRNSVLVMRTLDLLRLVDLVEQGAYSVEDFQRVVHKERGWLRVEDATVTVVRLEDRD